VSVRAGLAIVVTLAVALAGCAAHSRTPAGTTAMAAPSTPPATPATPPRPEPPRPADQLARISGELIELQNAVAKLMMSARQHDDQLLYLQRRLGDLESQARSARPATVPGFAPSAPMPTPLPPPPVAVAPPAPAPMPPRASAPPSSPAPPPAATVQPPAAPAAQSQADDLYQVGLGKYQAGDLDGAVVTLYEVVANYPTDPARERAQFLIADIFYSQKDYRGAIAEFESLITTAPAGSRAPEALLKIGLAQRSLGDEARARRAWERLVKEHPGSAAARQARTLLKRG